MPRFSLGGWQFEISLDSLLKRAKVHARLADYEQLAQGTAADYQARVAEIVNESIEDYLIANPVLGQAIWIGSLPTTGYQRLQGTVTLGNTSAAIVGSNTVFTDQLTAGDTVMMDGAEYTVGVINSDTSLTLTSPTPAIASRAGFPIYLVSSDALTRNLTIPTNLHNQDIVDIYFTNDTAVNKKRIAFLDPNAFWALDAYYVNGNVEIQYPAYWTYNEDRTALSFIPFPAQSTTTIEIVYRQKPTAITSSDIASPTSVYIYEIPTLHMDLLSMRVASALCLDINRTLSADLRSQYEAKLERAQKDITKQLAAQRRGQDHESFPGPIIDYNSIVRRWLPIGTWR